MAKQKLKQNPLKSSTKWFKSPKLIWRFLVAIILIFILIIVPLGIQSKYFQYIHAKIIWNTYCRNELIKLNPGTAEYFQKGDSILDCIFCEWIYKIFTEKPTGLSVVEYDPDNKITWESGEIYLDLGTEELKIKNLSPVSKLSMITSLFLYETDVTNLNFVKSMKELEYVSIDTSPVKDISGLRGKNIKNITFYNTCVSDLSPLCGMNLRIFNISSNQYLKDISALSTMTVEIIGLDNTGITSIQPLKTCKGLRSLSIDGCKVKDLSPLEGKNILYLTIENTLVEDLSPLLKIKSPEKLLLRLNGSPASKKPIPKELKTAILRGDGSSCPKTKDTRLKDKK